MLRSIWLICLVLLVLFGILLFFNSDYFGGHKAYILIPTGYRGAIRVSLSSTSKAPWPLKSGNLLLVVESDGGMKLSSRQFQQEWVQYVLIDNSGQVFPDQPKKQGVIGLFTIPKRPGIGDMFVGTLREATDAGFATN